jgi:ribosomal protein L14E/L6E/L27E
LDPVEVDRHRSDAEHCASAVTVALSRQEAPERKHDRELMAAGLFSACAAQNALAAMARTPFRRAQHERFAAWLEKFGQSLVDLSK